MAGWNHAWRAFVRSLAAWRDGIAETERGRFPLWLPVAMGSGIACYFALADEPPAWLGAAVAAGSALGAWLTRRRVTLCAPWLLASAAGIGLAAIQFAAWRAAPLEPLPRRAVVVSGTVGRVELLPGDARRVTLTQPSLHPDMPPLQRDLRIRLRANDPAQPRAGDRLGVRALLRPPLTPVHPGAWDPQRDAFFAGMAGGGMALAPVTMLTAEPPGSGLPRGIQKIRERIAQGFVDGMPGAAGAIASALFTGSTAAIPRADQAAFRDSGLAHLLAVSGLHVAIVTGLVFALMRALLALSEHAALHWPCKQIAALTGLGAALLYTPLAGAQVPLLRSVAMTALVVLGILAGRRAFTLRALALAAVAVLLLAPWQLVGPSLQMSFSAVLALIAGHDALRPALLRWRATSSWPRRAALYVFLLAMTSLLAGSASAPFGIYHFGKVQIYFILANLLAVPLTGLWVMPCGLLALALMPFGLEYLALVPMAWGLETILWVAHATASLPASTFELPDMPLWGLLAYTLGLLWLGLWRGGWRLLGLAPILLGLVSPALRHRADVLVSADAALIAVRVDNQVYLRQDRGAGSFVHDGFARYWAGPPPLRLPADVPGRVICDAQSCRLRPRAEGAFVLVLMQGEQVSPEHCAGVALVVAASPLRHACPGVPFIDRFTVWREGAFAAWLAPAGTRLVSDRADRGQRPWVEIPLRRRPELPPAMAE